MSSQKPTSIELFTGAGGLALGVSRAGFSHIALVESNRDAVASLNANATRLAEMRDWPLPMSPQDAREVDFSKYAGRVNLVAAGAPCQPFSLGGKHSGHADARNLFPVVFRAVRDVQPEVVVIENVKGLLRESFRDYFEYIELQLRFPAVLPTYSEDWRRHKAHLARIAASSKPKGVPALRYNVVHQLLNAADYGVPQRRHRVFIIALRCDLDLEWVRLTPTHSEDALLYAQYVTGSYWREHKVKQKPVPAKLARRVEELRLLKAPPKEHRWLTVRDAILGLPTPKNGAPHATIDNHVGNPGARVYPGHTGSPLDLPAKTLKAGDHGVPGGENVVVLDDGSVRYFTVREAARVQGFPDNYLFAGAWCEGFRQLGNAVPVGLAEVVAARVRALLKAAQKRNQVA